MIANRDLDARLAVVDRFVASPPTIHPEAENGAVWSTEVSCYRFMARNLQPGSRTLETGAGLSTVLFAAWGCDHLSIVPFEREADAILEFCAQQGVETGALRFDLRPSEVALPEMIGAAEFDLVLIDGCHGFPMPIIDWFYAAGLLRKGGIAVIDDVQIPQVRTLVDLFIDPDERWLRLDHRWKWIAHRRLSEGGSLTESETRQQFFVGPRPSPSERLKDVIPLRVKTAVKRFT